ncbi:DUF2894 domain-containing protein [Ideonella paludis]|uniref:DUF2894 domain-containing protein n=1 Tax=Ideonella paludis TaxID=1233411 RepID=A0ABS5DRU6_9BURK|nr:DUF2894 domain-containing protein [Ideonella paludis]MBQ0933860.1 DUF2894 domain-containing protein [Ideonella paludis]
MSTAAPSSPQALPDVQAALQALRQAGAPRWEPLRWQYVASLAERLQAAPLGQQALLQAKLAQGLADCQARLAQRPPTAQPGAKPKRPPSALAQLNQAVAQAAAGGLPGGPSATQARPELKSAQRFRESWAVLCAEEVVDQASTQAPQNAGPLNAHRLVLHTLGLLRDLSPDYLRRFLTHTETLMWLEGQQGRAAAGGAPKTRR